MSKPITNVELRRLLQLLKDATPGTWQVNRYDQNADEVERYQLQSMDAKVNPKPRFPVLGDFYAEDTIPKQALTNALVTVDLRNMGARMVAEIMASRSLAEEVKTIMEGKVSHGLVAAWRNYRRVVEGVDEP